MSGILKSTFSFFMECFFDHKDEYNFHSEKFNVKRVLVMVFFILTFSFNIFITVSYFKLAHNHISLVEKIEEEKASKNNVNVPSDSQNLKK